MGHPYEKLLPHVQRPGRYIGSETNAVVKDWGSAELKFALVFPDLYEVGMSHLGAKILYHVLNDQPHILCERAFAAGLDMERLLRRENLPLVSLENNKPLREFDIVGFSLSHELCYTNVLNILEMSGIPLHCGERTLSDPLVIAGGPCAFNPEPMADFIDLFLIGDGESAVVEIADRYLRCRKNKNRVKSRMDLLRDFLAIKGVYIPCFYRPRGQGSAYRGVMPLGKDVPVSVGKRTEPDLEKCLYPTRQVISYIPLVHDRISLEIMRGCPHRCRFCQASTLYAPRRMRSRDTVMRLARETQKKTGHNEISLLSLSTGDYPGIGEILANLADEFKPQGVRVSLPSLRINSIIESLPPLVKKMKKTGLTFAPEVGSEKLRRFINKNIDRKDLAAGAKIAYELGWKKIKLYFMLGFPGEDDKDLDEIIALAEAAAGECPRRAQKGAKIALSISSFIPKPHTPFQWERMESRALLIEKVSYIKRNIRKGQIIAQAHDVDMSLLEGVFARGDRALGRAVEQAFRLGARFDSWGELFDVRIWHEAFQKCGISARDYLDARAYERPLPWDHIHAGISRAALMKESVKARRAASLPL